MMKELPEIIQGACHEDERGRLTYFNDFDLAGVNRFYVIEHPGTEIIRAWQGHKKEQKWFYVIGGSFKVVIVKPDDWTHPSHDLDTREFILKSEDRKVLHVPGNFANGFKALEPDSKMMIFSNFSVVESTVDNFRFDKMMWYNWNKIN